MPELVELRNALGLPIERDIYFSPCHLQTIMEKRRDSR